MTIEPEQVHYIRLELPAVSTEEQRDKLFAAVTDLADKYRDEFDYDINVDGGAWYPPVEEETTPYAAARAGLRKLIFGQLTSSDGPVDAEVMRAALQELQRLGMSQQDLIVHLECERAINSVALRNEQVENNLLNALSMVVGYCSPQMRIDFQAGTT